MRGLLRALTRCFDRFTFPGHMPPDAGIEEAREELDLAAPGEPRVELPGADLSETERREAVRQYKRELEEKRQR